MLKLQRKDIYLALLEREHCRTLWNEAEYDEEHPTEELRIGHSDEKAGEWFEEIQRQQWNTHVRLGIFLNDGRVIGD